jgi:hypothetical protein
VSGGETPAVLYSHYGIGVLLLHQLPTPVDVAGIQPIVIDGQGVFHILNAVVPATWHENGLVHSL